MTIVRAGGVDPGLVHTGVVRVDFIPDRKMIHVWSNAVLGTDAPEVRRLVLAATEHVWIEGYKPRSHFTQDKKLVEFIKELKAIMPKAIVLDNMGVKKVVTKELMQVLNMWTWPKVTHHQDLRSAARIMLYGMLKDDELNKLLSDIVRDHINQEPWSIQHF